MGTLRIEINHDEIKKLISDQGKRKTLGLSITEDDVVIDAKVEKNEDDELIVTEIRATINVLI